MMDLTLETVEKLMALMTSHNIERLEYDGLVLCKGKEIKTFQLPVEDKKVSDVPAIIPNIPSWAKGKEHLMFAAPFPEPHTEKDE